VRIVLLLLAAVVGLALVALLVGALLPRTHLATRAASYSRAPSDVYAVIRDFASMQSWRPDVRRVEILPPRAGHPCFREASRNGTVTYLVLEDQAPGRIVTRIADESLPFGGTWTYEISREPGGCRVRITERGEIRNALFRFVARFILGYTATMESYLRDLGTRLGESVEPVP
jgi:hypothetical protein